MARPDGLPLLPFAREPRRKRLIRRQNRPAGAGTLRFFALRRLNTYP